MPKDGAGEFLTKEQTAKGYCLPCQIYPTQDMELISHSKYIDEEFNKEWFELVETYMQLPDVKS